MRTRTVLLAVLFFVALAMGGTLLGGCAAEFDDLGSIHVEPPKGVRFGFGKPADILAGKAEHYRPPSVRETTLEDMIRLQRQQQFSDKQLGQVRP